MVLASCQGSPAPDGIILIAVDTLRADRLGLYGHDRPISPVLDAWAEEAVIFEHAQATSPWTLPTFASIFTGRLPSGHGAGGGQKRAVHRRAPLAAGVTTVAERLREAGFATGGFVTNPFLKERFGLSKGFETWDYEHHRPAVPSVARALGWLDDHREEPFFLFLHLIEPHLPYRPPESVAGRFTGPGPHPWEYPILGTIRRSARHDGLTDDHERWISALYDEEVAAVDAALDTLFRHLRETGLDETTLVVFTSDHGEELFDHGGFEHGHTLYQELLHVPLALRGPGIAPRRVEEPVSVADLAPTLLDAVGLEPSPDVAGLSLWPHVVRDRPPPRRPLVSEQTLYGSPRWAVVEWPWKLERIARGRRQRLFHLERDPLERTDRADERPEVARRLSASLDEILARSRAAPRDEAVETPLDSETLEDLRTLGYVE